jgi:hypothetical protein
MAPRISAGLHVAIATAVLAVSAGRLCAQHDHASSGTDALTLTMRQGSGTAWLPTAVPTTGTMRGIGAWMLMIDGSGTLLWNDQGTPRGAREVTVTDWEMLMAARPLAGGALRLSLMTSLQPLFTGGDGYAELLQTGGTYRHAVLHDRQHPHDALVEAAAQFDRAGPAGATVSFYAAAVGEPALGPVSYMHRPSAMADPMAPLGHHWQDAAHQSFGVVTLGLGRRTLRIEGSLFNAREADEHHLVADYRGARLDSYAGRLSWAPIPQLVASSWFGFLGSHDRLAPDTRMHRFGASLVSETRGPWGGRLSSTVVWGVNVHHHGPGSHELLHGGPGASPHHRYESWLAESALQLGATTTLFARAERVQKNGEELGFLGGDLTAAYDVRSVVAGVRQDVASLGSVRAALGARGAVNLLPASLQLAYGTRTTTGAAVYLQLRAARGITPAR